MQSAPKPCKRCGVLVRDGSALCDKHKQAGKWQETNPGTRHERGYGTAWDKLRPQIFQRDRHLCQACLQDGGRCTPATHVDHIRNRAEGGTDSPANLQSLCRACHQTKTQQEARRGRGM